MSNGEVCCILGICCPPDAARAKLAEQLGRSMAATRGTVVSPSGGVPTAYAEAAADYVLSNFDLAPKGTLQPLVDYIVSHVKKEGV